MSDLFEVTAIKVGFIHGQLKQVNSKFKVSEKEFSSSWMVKGKAVVTKDYNDKGIPTETVEILEVKPVEKEVKKEKPKKTKPKKAKSETND